MSVVRSRHCLKNGTVMYNIGSDEERVGTVIVAEGSMWCFDNEGRATSERPEWIAAIARSRQAQITAEINQKSG